MRLSPCLCLTSPVAGGGRMHVSCCSNSSTAQLELAVSCGIQETLNPSNCSRPQSISSAKAESCICFSKG